MNDKYLFSSFSITGDASAHPFPHLMIDGGEREEQQKNDGPENTDIGRGE